MATIIALAPFRHCWKSSAPTQHCKPYFVPQLGEHGSGVQVCRDPWHPLSPAMGSDPPRKTAGALPRVSRSSTSSTTENGSDCVGVGPLLSSRVGHINVR